MTWTDLERSFLGAWGTVFSRKKILAAFVALSLSGLFFIFCHVLAIGANSWVRLSLFFLPVLVSTAFLLMGGVLLIRMHAHESRGLGLKAEGLFSGLMEIFAGTSYLSFPPIVAYLCLSIVLGLFFLLKEIPFIGPFFNIIFAFAPFLLIFCSLVLCFVNFCLLFFLAPAVARRSLTRFESAWKIWLSIKARPFLTLTLFFIGIFPGLLIGSALFLAALLTQASFALESSSFAIALEWFFIMLPFAALLSPALVFFFQFAADSHPHLQRQ